MATQQQRGAHEPLAPDLQHQPPPLEKELLRKDRKFLNGCVPLSHQVAGHMYGKDKVGILQHPDGTVLKQLQPPPRGPRELDFYNMVRQYLYLKLEDVTRKFTKPCIMDVKIGQKSYDPHASAEKIQQQISKYPLMEEIGFLVLGMRGLSKFFNNGCHLRKDAVSACLQKVQNILHWFENQDILHFYASSLLFVYDGSCPQPAITVGGKVYEKKVPTTELLTDDEVTECNNNISMLSSMENGKNEEKKRSRIYAVNKKTCPKRLHSEAFTEGEILEEDKTRKNQNNLPQEHLNGNLLTKLENVLCQVSADLRDGTQVDVRMIDFAHVFPSEEKDRGYIYGLKNLISVLQSILNE
ncbi:hypothetical protein GDO78_008202 [Eleutherodactylus coqui]|uniref:Kinase n=1 Tax=Eleutherodactylus coqui TaxID=57060 RepID=A0A8J6FCB8_ELECQ|nr:hypothetical protein GDO78_008202 [Eleutherodactylus coqui]